MCKLSYSSKSGAVADVYEHMPVADNGTLE